MVTFDLQSNFQFSVEIVESTFAFALALKFAFTLCDWSTKLVPFFQPMSFPALGAGCLCWSNYFGFGFTTLN